MSEVPPQGRPASEPPAVTLYALFSAFLSVALSGFGGVLPWARGMLVERRRWLTEEEFVDTMGLCQFLPGPNIINMSIIVGSRLRGPLGSVAAFIGLVATPCALTIAVGALVLSVGEVAWLERMLAGISAAASGLIIATAIKMSLHLRKDVRAVVVIVVVFAAVALFRVPLLAVLLIAMPLSVAIAFLVGARRP